MIKKKHYTIYLKCGCVYCVIAEDKGHADCMVDYLHYIDTQRDKIKKCKGEVKMKKKIEGEVLPDCETCKKCGTNNCGNDTTNLQCYEPEIK